MMEHSKEEVVVVVKELLEAVVPLSLVEVVVVKEVEEVQLIMHMNYMEVQKWTTFGKKWKVSTKSRNRRHIRKVVQKWTTFIKKWNLSTKSRNR